MSVKNAWKIIRQTFAGFFTNNVLKLSGSLAFFTVFSLPGLLIIIIWISNFFYGREVVEATVYQQMEGFIGHSAALDIRQAIHNAMQSTGNNFATIVGLVSLILGATNVFGEIQDSINLIWKLRARPRKGWAWLKFIINRLLSFSMIITLGFILLVSLVLNGAMDILLNHLMEKFPRLTVVLVYSINLILTFLISTFIFGAIFKVLPDARIEWKHVRIGAFVTAFLFIAGKFLISFYLGHSTITSAYGTAGSVIVILLWVYYSAMILYFGAVFTHVYVVYTGSKIYPNNYAVWVQEIEVESAKSIQHQPEAKAVIKTPETSRES
ncbi:MAG: YihY/virulence factor BrkB family protein [Bacteroidota bacterium]